MENEHFTVLGVMSGTSLDGVDIALLHFKKATTWSFEIREATTIPYDLQWKERLRDAFYSDREALTALDEEYTRLLAGMIRDFIADHSITQLDAVCSHGHTIWHRPAEGITIQIGNRPELARWIGVPVVCDFRVQDVELGGQGAPLVPVGDRLLFSSYRYCLNLGGFANVSEERPHGRLAYDVCPVNTVLNHYASMLGADYDAGGLLARSGKVDPRLLEALNALPFYREEPPKSLGVEWVTSVVIPLIEQYDLDPRDVLATYTHHVADQLALALPEKGSLLITGGGAFNTYLLELLQERIQAELVQADPLLIDNKEALIFGLLGVLRLRGEVNCLQSVTGASRDHCSGKVYLP